jgi:methylenetetrahydrofolate--tRNA-(uracil-5-)-methyltransferase
MQKEYGEANTKKDTYELLEVHKMIDATVNVIGAGLAGSEAAWQLAKRGIKVRLFEMRPVKQTPAHHTDKFAELVCSNSLRANNLTNAVGVLKEEMRKLDSVIISSADACAVPAGGALAVDRHEFAAHVTDKVKNHPNVTVIHEEITEIPEGPTVIATGPLTSPALSAKLQELTGEEYLYFYDAAAPIIEKDSIDMDKVYLKSRYDKGEAAYLNCPMTEEEFDRFYDALVSAETVPLKEFEKEIFFEGCMPIEVMASRGKKTMLFGPMKPVGLEDPNTGKRPFAVVQLRQDDAAGTLYNIVGFQTHLKWGPQKEVLQLIPGLENAEIVRYGVMHRNTFINSPKVLEPTYQFKNRKDLFFAGQMTGVEGYVESAASGLVAGLNAARLVQGEELVVFPEDTAIGSMARYITNASAKNFQPMNANFGLFPELPTKIRGKKERAEQHANRALETIQNFVKNL